MLTIPFLTILAQQMPETIAVETPEVDISYGELVTAVNALAVALQTLDPIEGSRVAVYGDVNLNYWLSTLAIHAAGKVMVPLSLTRSGEELMSILNTTQPTAILTAKQHTNTLPCDNDLIICFEQFEGLVRTYAGQTPTITSHTLSCAP